MIDLLLQRPNALEELVDLKATQLLQACFKRWPEVTVYDGVARRLYSGCGQKHHSVLPAGMSSGQLDARTGLAEDDHRLVEQQGSFKAFCSPGVSVTATRSLCNSEGK
jgi:hypothetical protein